MARVADQAERSALLPWAWGQGVCPGAAAASAPLAEQVRSRSELRIPRAGAPWPLPDPLPSPALVSDASMPVPTRRRAPRARAARGQARGGWGSTWSSPGLALGGTRTWWST